MTDFKRELEIEVNGEKLLLRGSFKAIREIQTLVGKPINQITHDVTVGSMPIEVYAAAIYGGLLGSGTLKGRTFDDIGEMVVNHGYAFLGKDVAKFLLLCAAKDPAAILSAEVPDAAEVTQEKKA